MASASESTDNQSRPGSGTKETAVVLLTQGWTAVSAIVTQGLLAWLLGPAGRGAYAVCVLFASILGVFLTLGVDRGAQYYVMSQKLRTTDAIMAMTMVVAGGSAVGIGVGAVLIDSQLEFFGKADRSTFLVALGLIPAMILWTAYRLQSAGLRRFAFLGKIDVVRTTLNILLLFAFVSAMQLSVEGALLAQIAALVVVTFLIVADFVRQGHLVLALPPIGAIHDVCAYGLKYYVARIGHVIDMGMGTFLLALLATREEIGLFAAASALTLSMLMLPQSIEVTLLPRIATDPAGRPDLVARVARFSALATLVLAVCLGALAHPVVSIVLSPKFLEAVPIIRVLAIGAVVQAFGIILMSFFRGNNQPQICSLAVWAGLATNGIGLLILYPMIGVTGAAIAMTAGFILRTSVLVFFYCRVNGVSVLQLTRPTRQDFELLSEGKALIARRVGRGGQKH